MIITIIVVTLIIIIMIIIITTIIIIIVIIIVITFTIIVIIKINAHYKRFKHRKQALDQTTDVRTHRPLGAWIELSSL